MYTKEQRRIDVKGPGYFRSLDVQGILIHSYDLNIPFSHRYLLCLLCFLW